MLRLVNNNAETDESLQDITNSIHGSTIIKESITANKIFVSDLSAFNATIGGFIIDANSIHTTIKTDVDSNNPGLYMDNQGQFSIGDNSNSIKYYYDSNNSKWVLDVRLSKLYLGSSEMTADQEISSMVELSASNITGEFRSTGGSNLLKNSVGFKGMDYWLILAHSDNFSH